MALDIKKSIATRKFHQQFKPFYWFYHLVMHHIGKKYNATYNIIDDIKKEKGPAFIIFNHLSRLDHVYVLETCYPRRFNMLAGYNEFYRSHLHFAFKYNNVLPKKQYTNDLLGTRAITKIVKQGGVVAFAPEGLATNDGMNKPIVPGTGHMLKHFGIPVYFLELRGNYLQNTKVCLDERYGHTFATLKKVFTPEDLNSLSPEEIDDKINEMFKGDEYAWQQEKHFYWDCKGRPAYNLHHLLYRCPRCGNNFTMTSDNTKVWCTNCNNGATIDDFYQLSPMNSESIVPNLVSDWVKEERINIIREIRRNPEYRFARHIKLGMLPNDHYVKDLKISEVVTEGILLCDHNGLHFISDNDDKYNFDIDYKRLYTLITEVDSNSAQFYNSNGELIDMIFDNGESIFLSMLIEEMHRLHVNYYKNFKWNSYMYDIPEDNDEYVF